MKKMTVLTLLVSLLSVYSVLVYFNVPVLAAPLQGQEPIEPRSRILVLPFRTAQNAEVSYSWLGRALSYYLTAGLHSNGFTVRQDNEAVALLDTHAIFFPYPMTKATALRLALDNRQQILVWGDVGPDPKDKTRILVSGSVMDLKNFSRKKLPIFRGHVQDIFLVMEALFKSVVTLLKPGMLEQPDFHFPAFRLNPRNYEIFIKSLLLAEPEKKIELLEKARATDLQSEYLNLHLARAYFDKQQYPQARTLLAQVATNANGEGTPEGYLFTLKKKGLHALLDYAEGNTTGALDAFLLLEKEKYELFEVCHNLAVIYYQRKEYGAAEHYFNRALEERRDPETWFYHIHNLLAASKSVEAEQFLKTALKKFPENSKLVGLFAYFLSRTPVAPELFELFQNYIPDLVQVSELPAATMALKIPFNVILPRLYSDRGEFREIENSSRTGTDDTAIERLGALIEANPFLPKYYRLMSHLYLKKKEYSQAERHALAAVFLEPSRESYLTLTVVYQATGKRLKLKELEERMTRLTGAAK